MIKDSHCVPRPETRRRNRDHRRCLVRIVQGPRRHASRILVIFRATNPMVLMRYYKWSWVELNWSLFSFEVEHLVWVPKLMCSLFERFACVWQYGTFGLELILEAQACILSTPEPIFSQFLYRRHRFDALKSTLVLWICSQPRNSYLLYCPFFSSQNLAY